MGYNAAKIRYMNRLNYSTNYSPDSFGGVLISMIDLKKVGKLKMDTCPCEAVETQHIETRDNEGNCTCNTETRTIEREWYCSCDDN